MSKEKQPTTVKTTLKIIENEIGSLLTAKLKKVVRNIGDKVVILITEKETNKPKITQAMITAVRDSFGVDKNTNKRVHIYSYVVTYVDNAEELSFLFEENNLFDTKEELIKSIS